MNLKEIFSNSWWGKLLGAFFGFLVGGSIGAGIGILIGNIFDKGLSRHFSSPHLLYHSEKREAVQKIFFEATFAVMGHIAKADGHVSQEEIQMAKLLMSEMRLSKKQQEFAKLLFNEGKNPAFKLEIVLSQLQRACKDNRELLKLFIDIQYKSAQVDGLSAKKIKALDKIFSQLGFAPLNQQYRFYEDFSTASAYQYTSQQDSTQKRQQSYKPQPKPQTSLEQAYALLEISPSSSKQEAKKIYRRLLSKNHPDKLIAQGLPEEMIKMANEKTHKIMKAYELICQTKGWV